MAHSLPGADLMTPSWPAAPSPRSLPAPPSLAERIAPTHRPPWLPAGYQDWRSLLFVHWPVPAEAIQPLVPPPLTVDLFGGSAYVSLTPFVVRRARALGTPRALGLSFFETNVRTYVHLDGREPAIYFFSLDAASLLAVLGARASLGLPYFHAWMRMHREGREIVCGLRRRWGGRPGLRVRYEIGEPLGASRPGTLQHFLIERYLAHVERGPSLWTIQVHHAPYPVRGARVLELADDLVAAAGIGVPTEPALAHFSPGVDVAIFPPRIRPRAP